MATRPDLRIGNADREATVAVLREHYAQGRLSLEEFNERLDATFAATTQSQLERITHDLPHVTTPHVPLPVATARATGGGGGGGARAGQHGGTGRLIPALIALMAFWFVVHPGFATHFHLFSWPGRFSVLMAGLLLARSLVRRIFRLAGRRR